jgi:hypothetical protein
MHEQSIAAATQTRPARATRRHAIGTAMVAVLIGATRSVVPSPMVAAIAARSTS